MQPFFQFFLSFFLSGIFSNSYDHQFFNNFISEKTENQINLNNKNQEDFTSFLEERDYNLEIWTFDIPKNDFDWIIQVFQKSAPNVEFSIQVFSDLNYYFSKVSQIPSLKNPPDLVLVKNFWMPQINRYFSYLPSNFSKQNCQKDFFNFCCQIFSAGEKMFAFPVFVDGLVMIFRSDFLMDDRISVGDQPGKNWSEFLESYKNFSKFSDGDKIFIENFGIKNKPSEVFLLFLSLTQQTENEISIKILQDALETLSSIFQTQSSKQFSENFVAVKFLKTLEAKKIMAKLSDDNNYQFLKTTKIPQVEVDKNISVGESWAFAIPINSNNIKAAKYFLNFLNQEKNLFDLLKKSQKISSKKDDQEMFLKILENSKNPPKNLGTVELENLFWKNFSSFLSGEISSQTAAKNIFLKIK